MDVHHIDSLSRALALGGSRRRLLMRLVGGALAAPRMSTVTPNVSFDPATGTGFFDSEIVRADLGWDAQQMQNEATALGFMLAEKASYTGVCSTRVGSTVVRTDTILANEIQYDGATVTGFILTGKEHEVHWQAVPQVGATCSADNVAGTWLSVAQTSQERHLYIGCKGIQIHLWPGSAFGILRDYCR